MEPIKRGAIYQATCKLLAEDDCNTHPNCQWTKAYTTKTGAQRRAGCGNKASPSRITRVSQKRSAGSKRAATKNPWFLHRAEYIRTHDVKGMSAAEISKAAKPSYIKKQKGGFYDMFGAGCGINPSTNFCKSRPGDDDAFCFKGNKRCQKKKNSGAPKGRRVHKSKYNQSGAGFEDKAKATIAGQVDLYKGAIFDESDLHPQQDLLLEDLYQIQDAIDDDSVSIEEAVNTLQGVFDTLKQEGYKIGMENSRPGPGATWKALVAEISGPISNREHNPEPRLTEEQRALIWQQLQDKERAEESAFYRGRQKIADLVSKYERK